MVGHASSVWICSFHRRTLNFKVKSFRQQGTQLDVRHLFVEDCGEIDWWRSTRRISDDLYYTRTFPSSYCDDLRHSYVRHVASHIGYGYARSFERRWWTNSGLFFDTPSFRHGTLESASRVTRQNWASRFKDRHLLEQNEKFWCKNKMSKLSFLQIFYHLRSSTKRIADWGAFVKMSKCPIARFVRLSDFHSSYLVSETMTDIPNVAKLSAGPDTDVRQHRSSFPGLSKM